MLLLKYYMPVAAPIVKQSCDFIIEGFLFYHEDQPTKQSVG